MARKRATSRPQANSASQGDLNHPGIDPASNPVGHSPFDGTPFNPSDLEGNLVAQFAPVAQTVMSVDKVVQDHLHSELIGAGTAVGAADSGLKVAIATQMTPAHLAIGAAHQAVSSQIRMGLNLAAEAASTGMQEPVLLNQAIINPTPGKVSGSTLQSQVSVPTPATNPPNTSAGKPAPIVPEWVSYALSNGGMPNPAMLQALASGDNTPSGTGNPYFLDCNAGFLKAINFCNANPGSTATICWTCPNPQWGNGPNEPQFTTVCYSCGASSTTPTPTPTTPTPTPTTPSPTPTTPSPTPTPIVPTPIVPTPSPTGPPAPPDTPCPDGYVWTWNGSYYTCTKVPPTPTPVIPPPTPPTPTPTTPTPTPPDGGFGGGSSCGATKDDPCWIEVACTQGDDFGIFIGSYTGNLLQTDQSVNPSACYTGDMTMNLGFSWQDVDGGSSEPFLSGPSPTPAGQAMASGLGPVASGVKPSAITNPPLPPGPLPADCQLPYKITVVTAGTDVLSVMPNIAKLSETIREATAVMSREGGIVAWTVLAPVSVLSDWLVSMWIRAYAHITDSANAVNAKIADIGASEAVFKVLNTVTFGALRKWGVALKYKNDLTQPMEIPSVAEADAAFLSNEIDSCTYMTYVQANDVIYERHLPVMQSGKLKFSALELAQLYMRQGIDRGNLSDRLRELGSLHEEDLTELQCLTTQLPGPSDVIRMMVRDVVNPNVVDTFNLDAGFTDNYQGILQDWAGNQGLPDKVMQMFWRAHWDIPSPTQLYEILRRCRHDPQFGGPGQVEQNVTTALVQQDILPFWIPYLLTLAYHPLTRTDLNRAYSHGWISDDDYVDGMYQDGYSDDDAQTLLRFAESERTLTIRSLSEVHTYRKGFMSDQQLIQALTDLDFSPEIANLALTIAGSYRQIDEQESILKKLDQGYRTCRIDDDSYQESAEEAGIDQTLIDYRLNINRYYTTCASRHETIAALCQALDQNLIGPQDYLDRAKILKYDDVAAMRYLELCQNAKQRRAAQELAKQQAKAQKDAEKALKAAEKEAKQDANQAQKILAQAAKIERARQARNRILEDASSKYAAHLGVDGVTASAVVGTTYESIQQAYGLSQTEAANAVNLTTTQKAYDSAETFRAMASGVALSALSDPYILYNPAPILDEG